MTAREHLYDILRKLREDATRLEATRWWERGYRRDRATARAIRYVAAAVSDSAHTYPLGGEDE